MTMYEEIRRAYDNLQFWSQLEGDAKRTLVAHPDKVERVRAVIREAGLDDAMTVIANAHVPPGRVYVIDTPAMEADARQDVQKRGQQWRWPWNRTRDERWRPEFDVLARYNAEVWRGIQHTPEWRQRMVELQRLFDQAYGKA